MAALTCLAMAAAPTAGANAIYTYQGNNFTNIIYSPVFTVNESIEVTATFTDVLPPDLPLSTPTDLVSFSMSNGVEDLAGLTGPTSSFLIATGPDGTISEWGIETSALEGVWLLVIYTDAGPGYGEDTTGLINPLDRSDVDGAAINYNDPGKWSAAVIVPDAVPEPAACPFIALALLALVWLRRNSARAIL